MGGLERLWEEQLGFFACLFFLPPMAARHQQFG